MDLPKELKFKDGRHEIWATGSVASCDYAGMIFAYGYYVAGVFVPATFIVSVYILYRQRAFYAQDEIQKQDKQSEAELKVFNLDQQ